MSEAVWLVAVATVALGTAACGTSPNGVDTCKQLEEARCARAGACGISTQPPYSTAGDPVAACTRFYDIACLHGLAVQSPTTAQVNACIAAIQSSPCDGGSPLFETDPACSWLTLAAADAAITSPSSDAAEAASQ